MSESDTIGCERLGDDPDAQRRQAAQAFARVLRSMG